MKLFESLLPPTVVLREADPRRFSADLSTLHNEEAALVRRAVDKRKREYTAGRTLAREVFRELGVDDLVLVNDAERAPQWPDGFVGSITHTHFWCAAAAARQREHAGIGLDVERDLPLKENLWDTICTPEEQEWLLTQSGEDRGWLGKVLFSAKEAAYKAQYGVSATFLGFHAMRVTLRDNRFQAVFARDVQSCFRVGDQLQGRWVRRDGLIATAVVLPPNW
ncbi:MAG: 4'-phosphopantetheinyl transferase superfamily protein [Myxococcota bacterium]